MINKLVVLSLLSVSVLAANPVGSIVSGADGRNYKLVKAAQKLPSGATQVAEYVLVGDNSGQRYGMNLSSKGVKPTFWKFQTR